jgi:hypothetical protein
MNNQTSRPAVTPVLLDLLAGGQREQQHLNGAGKGGGNANPMIVPLRRGETVDILLINGRALNNASEQHPFHLHGHAFWLLGQGIGAFNSSALNTVDPPYRDMATLFPFGWALLRFQAGTNPGVWPFHCHIQPHALMGMNVVFIEDAPALAGALPPDGFGLCGRLASFSASDPYTAALFLRGSSRRSSSSRHRGAAPGAVPPLSLLLAFSLLANFLLLLRTPRARAFLDTATRRVLSLTSPRRRRHDVIDARPTQQLPTESPVTGGDGGPKGGDGVDGVEFTLTRSPVGS